MPENISKTTIQALVADGSLVSLGDSLSALRSQLEDAHLSHIEALAKAKALGKNPVSFSLGEVTVTFEMVASSSIQGGAKLSFWVASAEAQGKFDASIKQSVTIKLHVAGVEEPDGYVLGRNP
jgi:hypothetical protein